MPLGRILMGLACFNMNKRQFSLTVLAFRFIIWVVKQDQTYLFFDGVCGLCNGVVDFLLKFDSKQKILFVTLQSEFASQQLPQNLTQQLSTLVVKKGDLIFTKSEAVFVLINELGGAFKIFKIFQILPLALRNFVYDQIAKSRYQIFGKKDTCRIPTPQERSRFIT